MSDSQESRKIVRMYSWDAAKRLPPDNRLGRILTESVADQDPATITSPWRKFFEPSDLVGTNVDPVTRVLAIEAAKLKEKWLQFQTNSSKEDKLDLDAFEPTVDGVIDLVKSLNASVQAKRKGGIVGKIMTRFHKFCDKLDSHSNMLKILPDGNEYVSIFAGTLTTIIKASVNHERLAEDLADALCTISENVADCQAELEIFQTTAMLEKIADLYAHVFIFLSSYMDWIMRKRMTRLLDSFNENLFRKFEPDIKKITDRSNLIKSLVAQSSRAEVRATRLHVEDIKRDIRLGREGDARHWAEIEYYADRIERELIASRQERRELVEEGRQVKELTARLTQMLEERAMTWLGDQRLNVGQIRGRRSPSPFYAGQQGGVSIMAQSPPLLQWVAEDISHGSAHLEDFFHRDRVRLPLEHLGPSAAPLEVLQRLAGWTASRTSASNILWISGPSDFTGYDLENPVTMLAATVVDMAAQSKVPVLSYFCELRPGERIRDGHTPETQGLMALAFCLIRQMIELLLPVVETDIDLSDERFAELDGSMECWGKLSSLLTDLVPLLPASDKVFCIIDGLHWVDDRETEKYISDLVRILRESKLKVLLTTSARAPTLRDVMSRDETLWVDTLDDWKEDFMGVDREELYPERGRVLG
ncbi:phytanoyl-CoA dioxygenase [Podospora fimiseda]|uniref:Phytanoyl-CoA dioxygenase n=1 Tax=Podospora fimiseda TaxID=252190 RepID=A0AAN7BQR0_9PEZI|nr:phytanoyl-CoA dioxygenase [Podospora fimiseda]